MDNEYKKFKVFRDCINSLSDHKDEDVFLNIEEDIQGRDVLTYECYRCKEVHKSLIYG